ncbi:hypothetical protein A9K71_28840 [Mesorhizobium sp. WSM3873]|nr:hypothetical protein A9K71_28840 [Mesorhizobium sp. WSM3873]
MFSAIRLHLFRPDRIGIGLLFERRSCFHGRRKLTGQCNQEQASRPAGSAAAPQDDPGQAIRLHWTCISSALRRIRASARIGEAEQKRPDKGRTRQSPGQPEGWGVAPPAGPAPARADRKAARFARAFGPVN